MLAGPTVVRRVNAPQHVVVRRGTANHPVRLVVRRTYLLWGVFRSQWNPQLRFDRQVQDGVQNEDEEVRRDRVSLVSTTYRTDSPLGMSMTHVCPS